MNIKMKANIDVLICPFRDIIVSQDINRRARGLLWLVQPERKNGRRNLFVWSNV